MGVAAFEEWSNRLIRIAQIPGATDKSQKFALADLIMHLKPTEAFECDAYFVNCLRKVAANQVAHERMQTIRAEEKERLAKDENKVLANPAV